MVKKFLVFATCTFLLIGCRTADGKPDAPPQALIGTWKCDVVASIDLPSDTAQDVEKPTVSVEIAIDAEGRVSGHVGDAELKDCVYKRNRGWIGRKFNIKTDHIVCAGYLDGPVCEGDEGGRREFTIPLREVDDELRGTVMQLFKWGYPRPLTRQLHLVRAEDPGGS